MSRQAPENINIEDTVSSGVADGSLVSSSMSSLTLPQELKTLSVEPSQQDLIPEFPLNAPLAGPPTEGTVPSSVSPHIAAMIRQHEERKKKKREQKKKKEEEKAHYNDSNSPFKSVIDEVYGPEPTATFYDSKIKPVLSWLSTAIIAPFTRRSELLKVDALEYEILDSKEIKSLLTDYKNSTKESKRKLRFRIGSPNSPNSPTEEEPGNFDDIIFEATKNRKEGKKLRGSNLESLSEPLLSYEETSDLPTFGWPEVSHTMKDPVETTFSYLSYIGAVLGALGVGHAAALSSVERYYVQVLPVLQAFASPLSLVGAFLYALALNMDRAPPPIVRLFLMFADARFILVEPVGNNPSQLRHHLTHEHQQYLREFAKLMFDVINPNSEIGARFRWNQLEQNLPSTRDEIGEQLQEIIQGGAITPAIQQQLLSLIDTLVATENYLRLPQPSHSQLPKISPLSLSAFTFVWGAVGMLWTTFLAGNINNVTTKFLTKNQGSREEQESRNQQVIAIISLIPPVLAISSLWLQRGSKLLWPVSAQPDAITSYQHMARTLRYDVDRALQPDTKQRIYADDKKQLFRLNSQTSVQQPLYGYRAKAMSENRSGVRDWLYDRLCRTFAVPSGTLGWLPPEVQVRWIVSASVALWGGALIAWQPKNIDLLQAALTGLGLFSVNIIREAMDVLIRWRHSGTPGPRFSVEFPREPIVAPRVRGGQPVTPRPAPVVFPQLQAQGRPGDGDEFLESKWTSLRDREDSEDEKTTANIELAKKKVLTGEDSLSEILSIPSRSSTPSGVSTRSRSSTLSNENEYAEDQKSVPPVQALLSDEKNPSGSRSFSTSLNVGSSSSSPSHLGAGRFFPTASQESDSAYVTSSSPSSSSSGGHGSTLPIVLEEEDDVSHSNFSRTPGSSSSPQG